MSNNSEPIKGVIYYKLDSTYNGDTTKHCGLKSTEIDGNFFFLRGSDIESVEWNTDDNDNRILNLIRYNGEKISVTFPDFSSKISIDGTYFDSNKGILHLVINGEDNEIEGFNVKSIDSKEKYESTGFFAPVKDIIDLTVEDSSLPTTPKNGDRYITKETINKYGLLYNFAGVQEIIEKLKDNNSEWQVPSNEEWGEMLNAIELCDEDRNHISNKSNVNLGTYAGAFLKSDGDGWKTIEEEASVSKNYGFKALPVGGVGISAIQLFSLHNTPIQLVGESTEFWTSTSLENSDVWARRLDYNKNTVKQQAEGIDTYCSLRLIKKDLSKHKKIETILGKPYNTVVMPSVILNDKDEIIDGNNVIWTVENVSIPVSESKSMTLNNSDSESVYFINEWNGTEWVKSVLPNYGIVFIESLNKDKRLINGEIVDYNSSSSDIEDITNEVKQIKEKVETKADKSDVDSLSSSVLRLSAEVNKKADKQHTHEIDDVNGLSEKISSVNEKIEENIVSVSTLSNKLENIETKLEDKVDKEEGKGLSSNDFTSTEKEKLTNIENNAQENKIEVINLNGTPLTITNKSVNITIDESGASEPDIYVGDESTIHGDKVGKTTTFSVKEISTDKISDFDKNINQKLDVLTIDSSKVNGLDEKLNKKADTEYVNSQINDVIELIPSLNDYAKTSEVENAINQVKSDFNDELSKKSNSEDVDKIKQSLDTVNDTVGDTEKGLVKDVADIKSTINDTESGLAKKIADNTAAITETNSKLENTKTELNNSISENTNSINEINTKIGNNESGLVADVNSLKETVGNSDSGLVKKVDSLETETSTIKSNVNENAKDISNIEATINNEENGLLKRLTVAEGNIEANKTSINSISKENTTLKSNIESLTTNVNDISAKVEANKTNIVSINSNIDTIEAKVSKNENSISALSNTIDTFKVKDIASDDKILSLTEGIVSAKVSISYGDSTSEDFEGKKTIKLLGKDNIILSEIDASEFIKDGMLEDVKLEDFSELEPDGKNGKYLVFTFNTDSGKKTIYLDVTSLVNIYEAGNGINLNNSKFSVKIKDEEKYLSVDENGLSSKNIEDAISNAVSEKVDKTTFELYTGETNTNIETISKKVEDETTRATDAETSINEKLEEKADKAHTHEITDIIDLSENLSSKDEKIAANATALSNKVDKEDGKGLSSEDFTSEDKEKLVSIEKGAQINKINEIRIDGAKIEPENGVVNIKTLPSGGDSSLTYIAEDPIKIKVSTEHSNERIIYLNDILNFGEIE